MKPGQLPDLIVRAKGGDRPSFDEIAERYRPRLEALVDRLLGAALRSRVEPEDCVQETLVRAFMCLPQFRGGTEAVFWTWIKTIAHNVVRDQARSRRGGGLDGRLTDGDYEPAETFAAKSHPTPSRILRRKERLERLQEALDGLSLDHRRVILLARVEGHPIKEVARIMDRSPDATSMLLLRALLQLKRRFGSSRSVHLPSGTDLTEKETIDGTDGRRG